MPKKKFGDELVLDRDVVVDRNVRKAGLVVGRRGVGGRGREAVAEHVRDDDEVLVRVEGHAFPDQPLVLPVPPRVPRRVHDGVGLVVVERPESLVGELRVPERGAPLQDNVAQPKNLMVVHPVPLSLADGYHAIVTWDAITLRPNQPAPAIRGWQPPMLPVLPNGLSGGAELELVGTWARWGTWRKEEKDAG